MVTQLSVSNLPISVDFPLADGPAITKTCFLLSRSDIQIALEPVQSNSFSQIIDKFLKLIYRIRKIWVVRLTEAAITDLIGQSIHVHQNRQHLLDHGVGSNNQLILLELE